MTAELRRRIADAEAELQALRDQLAQAEDAEERTSAEQTPAEQQTQSGSEPGDTRANGGAPAWKWPLRDDEYERYARQLILPGVGVQGQLRLRNASVLIVGAGGLGCPAATYLAGAGVGHITIVDGDVVETSNLHRQIGHTTARVGQYKVDSLVASLQERNPRVRYTVHREHLTPGNASALVGGSPSARERRSEDQQRKTLVLDCTDHPAVRYLVSDTCVRAGVPLVSAAALRTDGQLAVLNWPVGVGPCYRCVFPRPPPAASQTSCAEGGVLGPVVGVMGVLQALEAIRVLVAGDGQVEASIPPPPPPTLTLFSAGGAGGALTPPSFRTVRLKGQRADCFACSADAPLKQLQSLEDVGSSTSTTSTSSEAWPDYVQFCGGNTATAQTLLQPGERVSVGAFHRVLAGSDSDSDTPATRSHWLLDVREKEFYNMGSIKGAVNLPFSRVQGTGAGQKGRGDEGGLPPWLPDGIANDTAPVYLVCRVGNDSQVVTRQLKALGLDRGGDRFVGDIQGGIRAWKQEIDSTMPFV